MKGRTRTSAGKYFSLLLKEAPQEKSYREITERVIDVQIKPCTARRQPRIFRKQLLLELGAPAVVLVVRGIKRIRSRERGRLNKLDSKNLVAVPQFHGMSISGLLVVGIIPKNNKNLMMMATSNPTLTAAILIISDTAHKDPSTDKSIPILKSLLTDLPNSPWSVPYTVIVPDEASEIKKQILNWTDRPVVNLVLTSGGTGFAQRDCTPEVAGGLIQREAPGLV
ncbi:MAG: hypothetical protein MMC33_007696 [Icmadophila ericetorum]|nr:hypothetical protein [Icmadophila ericetorum]